MAGGGVFCGSRLHVYCKSSSSSPSHTCPSSYITPPLYRVPFHYVSKPFRQNFIFVLENMTKNEISASKKNTKKNSVKQNYEKFKREYVFLTFVTLILSTHAWNKYLPPPPPPLPTHPPTIT